MDTRTIRKRIAAFHAEHPDFQPTGLRAVRQAMFLSQRDLADVSGVCRETIIRIESGAVKPYGPTVQRLAKALGFDPLTMQGATGRSEVR